MSDPGPPPSPAARPRRPIPTRTAAPSGPSPWRWPILVLLPVLIAVGVVVQRHQDAQPAPVEAISPDGFLPTASAAGATSSTWYCAGGTATGVSTGAAEQTIEIANDSDASLTGRMTVYPSQGAPATHDLDLPAHSRVDVAASSVVKAPYAAALVEVDGGEVAVSHLLEGPTGRSVAACSSSPSDSWWIPSGTTRAGTTQVLALFNPFPSEAVASVTFEAEDGARAPQDYEALVVPGQSVTILDISGTVTLRERLATTVTVRAGRLIVDQVQTADGTEGTTKSLTVTPGAPRAAATWWFADGPSDDGAGTVFYVQNPSDDTAEVELQIRLDDTTTYGQVEPFEVSIPGGSVEPIDVTADGRIPPGIGYAAIVQSTNGVDVVADQVVSIGAPATPTGATVTLGSPVLASRWIVPAASLTSASSAKVIVTNPSLTDPLTVTVSTVASGESTPLPKMRDVEIGPGERGGFDVPTGADEAQVAVDVTGGGPAVVVTKIVFASGGQAAVLAVPVAGTNQVAPFVELAPVTDDSVLDDSGSSVPDETLPADETIPPATDPTSNGTDTSGTGG